MHRLARLGFCLVAGALLLVGPVDAREVWPRDKAQAWYKAQPWLVGANYLPSSAINQLEMWQEDSFDPATIDRELGWAHNLGFTSMRVFLHHLPYEKDPKGFLDRVDRFLAIAHKHKIGVMLVLFDSCWDPEPKLGRQREPQKGVHNSGWVQSPGKVDLMDPQREAILKAYTQGVVARFRDDPRVVVWDIWNEPDNQNDNSYGRNHLKREPAGKVERTLVLLKSAFAWARAENPTQPLTSGVWIGNWPSDDKLNPTERVQLFESDVISFHNYEPVDRVGRCVENLKRFGRPILCTEYMARPMGSTFDPVLSSFQANGVGAYNWGFVAGKSQTQYPWDSWQKPYDAEPPVWFHDIFRSDGTPYRKAEVEFIQKVTGRR